MKTREARDILFLSCFSLRGETLSRQCECLARTGSAFCMPVSGFRSGAVINADEIKGILLHIHDLLLRELLFLIFSEGSTGNANRDRRDRVSSLLSPFYLPIGKGLMQSLPLLLAHTACSTFTAYGAPSELSGIGQFGHALILRVLLCSLSVDSGFSLLCSHSVCFMN